jgi:hypothetical protein
MGGLSSSSTEEQRLIATRKLERLKAKREAAKARDGNDAILPSVRLRELARGRRLPESGRGRNALPRGPSANPRLGLDFPHQSE